MSIARPPIASFDDRFSDAAAGPMAWEQVVRVLEEAELYWLTTVRPDRRPHVTPLVGVWHREAACFVTGFAEQKARNLEHNRHVALTTGVNTWASGVDVVLEGQAARVTDRAALQEIADAYDSKYGSDWHWEVGDGVFGAGDDAGEVFRILPTKVLAFGKAPHSQTTFRFGS